MAALAGPGAAAEEAQSLPADPLPRTLGSSTAEDPASGLGQLPDDLLRSSPGRVLEPSRGNSHAVVCRRYSSIESLPDDLLHNVLGRVSKLSGGYSHALVSRRWAALAPSAHLSCAISSGGAGESESREEQGGGCKDLSQASQELSLFPSLTSLDVTTTTARLPGSFLSSVSSSLQRFWVAGDRDYGAAPQGLARLQSLHTLHIPGYSIPENDWPLAASLRHLSVGIISEGMLERISELRELRVFKAHVPNDVIALPESMSGLTNLEGLALVGNGLRFLFSGIGNCKKLRQLTVKSNRSLQLPPSLTHLGCISRMSLEGRSISAPPSMEALTSLRSIESLSRELSADQAQALFDVPSLLRLKTMSLPSDMSMLTSLRELAVLGGNGSYPESMWALGRLQVLKLSFLIDLREVPESIRGLSCLEELTIQSCPIESLPESLALLPHIRKVVLDCTGICHLPESFSGLSRLEELRIAGCRDMKRLPDSLALMPHLRKLVLETTGLRYLPEPISGLSRLEELTVQDCRDMKHLPDSLALVPNLRKVVLLENTKLGYLPKLIDGAWPSLQSLHLQDLPLLSVSWVDLGVLLLKVKDVQISRCASIESENLWDTSHAGLERCRGCEGFRGCRCPA